VKHKLPVFFPASAARRLCENMFLHFGRLIHTFVGEGQRSLLQSTRLGPGPLAHVGIESGDPAKAQEFNGEDTSRRVVSEASKN